jgi:tetratricopeptide (TPR) repeat protein
MSFGLRFTISALLGSTFLVAAPAAMAGALPELMQKASETAPQTPRPHGLATSMALRQLDAMETGAPTTAARSQPASTSVGKIASASDQSVTDGVFSADRTVASMAAVDSAAGAPICEAYFTQSQALAPNLAAAYKAMAAGDKAGQAALLPALQVQFNGLLPYEIRPETCGGTHINAYTNYQFFQLSTLRARGIDTGLPADLPLVKQPDLNQSALAYTVGWIKYEQADFEGALSAFGKGLALYPHDHALQSEYLATLMQLQRFDQVVAFTDKVLTGTYDLTDQDRAKFYASRGIGLLFKGDIAGADDSLTVALRYQWSEEVAKMQTEIRAAAANGAAAK